jgi:hypothetical protein
MAHFIPTKDETTTKKQVGCSSHMFSSIMGSQRT